MENRVEVLKKWMKTEGEDNGGCYLSPKIEVRDHITFGRHVVAKSRIDQRETIMSVPRAYMLNYISILQHLGYWNPQIRNYLNGKGVATVTSEQEVNPEVGECETEKNLRMMYKKLRLEDVLGLSSFQLVCWYLVMAQQRNRGSFWKPFLDVLPTAEEFNTIPLTWMFAEEDKNLFNMLPKSTVMHVKKQYTKFTEDYAKVAYFVENYSTTMKVTVTDFLWSWLACNTRCLYMELPKFLHRQVEENFTLVPYVDFLNHAMEDHCRVSINSECFSVSTARSDYDTEQQILFSYGAHSDEILLCEYGFTLPYGQNTWNDLDISSVLTKMLKPHQREFLACEHYFGDYTITKDTTSFRTEVALAVMQERDTSFIRLGGTGQMRCPGRLRQFIDGYSDGGFYRKSTERIIEKIRSKIRSHYQRKLVLLSQMLPTERNRSRLEVIGACYKNILLIVT